MTTTSAGLGTQTYEKLVVSTLRGDLITPGDPGYDAARTVYHATIDRHPGPVARRRDTADVLACVTRPAER